MECLEYEDWVAADVDGVGGTDLEAPRRHVRQCARCRRLRSSVALARSVVRTRAPRGRAPAELRRRILAALDAEVEVESAGRLRPGWIPWSARAFAVAVVVAALMLARDPGGPSPATLEAYDLVLSQELSPAFETSSVSRLERFYRGHSAEVPSQVVDLRKAGFDLVGGLLHRPRAKMLRLSVYRDGEHLVVCDYRRVEDFDGRLPAVGSTVYLARNGLSIRIRRFGDEICTLASRMPLELFRARLEGSVVDGPAVDRGLQ